MTWRHANSWSDVDTGEAMVESICDGLIRLGAGGDTASNREIGL